MSEDKTLQINLDFNTNWCARHLEPFRENWPHGVATAMMLLLHLFVRDERTLKMAGYAPESDKNANPEHLQALVIECSPLCCFIGDEKMEQVASEALAGHGPMLDEFKEQQRKIEKGS